MMSLILTMFLACGEKAEETAEPKETAEQPAEETPAEETGESLQETGAQEE